MEKSIFKIDLSNSVWDPACFRSRVVGTKEVIYKLMENGSFADSENSIGAALYFLTLLEEAVPLVNGCSPNDSVEFPKIENSKELVRELVKRFLPVDVPNMMIPDYITLAEKLDVTASTGKGVFLYGGTGNGKSTFLLGLSQWLKDNKYPFIHSTDSYDYNKIIDFMNNFQEGVIIMDDLNGGYDSWYFIKILDRIEKSYGKFRLFAASSLSAVEFVKAYGTRCASILKSVCSLVEFRGGSFRKKIMI